MKNSFGQNITITLFGESHGKAIGCVLDGIAPGIPVDEKYIGEMLSKRRPNGVLTTRRCEPDNFVIESGVYNGRTTGSPICIIIPNEDTKSADYGDMISCPRPSHADFPAHIKYNGYENPNGGGHFSGRITAPIVAAAGILIPALNKKGIKIATHIKSIGNIPDRSFEDIEKDIETINSGAVTLDPDALEKMKAFIALAAKDGDSVGGVLETAVSGMPAGVGEPWFDTVEGVLSHAVFSIPAIKGVEFGDGFKITEKRGSEANDPIGMVDGEAKTLQNHSGGINGGITNGNTIIMRCAVKPTPTIYKEQQTVNFLTKENAILKGKGRHDPCVALRAGIVVSSITAIAIADLLATKYGTDWLVK